MSELSDQTRGIIFVIIAIAVLFLWSRYLAPPPPSPQKANPTNHAVAPAQNQSPDKPLTAEAPTPEHTNAKAENVAATHEAAEKTIVVESDFYRVELSNRGGVVRSWKLKKYLDDQKPPKPLDLVDAQTSQTLGWPFSLTLQDSQLESEANSGLYATSAAYVRAQTSGSALPVDQEANHFEAPVGIEFHYSDSHLDVTKKLSFNQSYELTVETTVLVDGEPVPAGIAWRGGFGDKEVYHESQLVNVFYDQGGKLNLLPYKKLGVSGNQSQPAMQAGPLASGGIEDQFFAAAFIPDGIPDMSVWHWMQNHSVTADGKEQDDPVAQMSAGTNQPVPLRMKIYVGPKDLVLLAKAQPALEGLVNFGYTGVIAKPLLFILQWLHKYITNYGWAIVVLTLVINFAMFPLKMKSWRSMQRMQKVGPEIRSIQDRYKKYSMSDPRKRKMNEEIMEIYQREGINPMGSCLPMVLQMPIWWALWRVLNGAIELRHAPWIFWIRDLSAKDPYYILPIAMAITMYLMTKMTPQTSVDPAQQKMMGLMPLMFAAFFFTMSSGLNLYMFTSNLIGVGQQYYLNRAQPLPPTSKFKKRQAA